MSISNLHYSSGRVLIKNTALEDSWNYVGVEVFDDNGTISINQVAVTPSVETYREYALLAYGNDVYKFTLTSFQGFVDYTLQLVADNIEPLDRLFLLGNNGNYYELIISVFEGNATIAFQTLSSQPTTDICSPFRTIIQAAEVASLRKSITPVNSTCVVDVVILAS